MVQAIQVLFSISPDLNQFKRSTRFKVNCANFVLLSDQVELDLWCCKHALLTLSVCYFSLQTSAFLCLPLCLSLSFLTHSLLSLLVSHICVHCHQSDFMLLTKFHSKVPQIKGKMTGQSLVLTICNYSVAARGGWGTARAYQQLNYTRWLCSRPR